MSSTLYFNGSNATCLHVMCLQMSCTRAEFGVGGAFNVAAHISAGVSGVANKLSVTKPLDVYNELADGVADQSGLAARILRYVADLGPAKTAAEASIPYILLNKAAAQPVEYVYPGYTANYSNIALALGKVLFCAYKVGVDDDSQLPEICESDWGSEWEFPAHDGEFVQDDIYDAYGLIKGSSAGARRVLYKLTDNKGLENLEGTQLSTTHKVMYYISLVVGNASGGKTYFADTIFPLTVIKGVLSQIAFIGSGYKEKLGERLVESTLQYSNETFQAANFKDTSKFLNEIIDDLKYGDLYNFNGFFKDPPSNSGDKPQQVSDNGNDNYGYNQYNHWG